MANQVQETISREADDIEQRKVGLMDSAKAQVDAANLSALQGEYLTPDYQVAGMSPDQLNALEMGRQGIGAYQPFLTAGARDVTAGSGMLSEAADVLRGADTRGQFAGAQAAMNQAALPIGQMGQSAQLATAGVPLIGMGAQGLGNAQNMANQYSQANMDQSMDTLQQGIGSLQNATGMYDPSIAAKSFKDLNNPYQQQVIQEAMRQIDRQGDISRQNLQAQATRAGAFGGSREGVQRAELERGLAEQKNAAIVGALSQGYNQTQQQAQQAFEADKARTLQQAQGYQNIGGLYGQQSLQQAQLGQSAAGLQGNLAGQQAGLASLYGNVAGQQANILGQQSQLGQSMAQGIGNLANQQFGIGQGMAQGLGALGTQKANVGMQNAALGQQAQAQSQQDTNFLYNLGSSQQKQAQSELDASRQNTLQQNMQPYQQMAFLSDIYRGAPSSQMSSMQQSQAAPSPFQQAAGLGIAGLSAVAAGSRAGILGP
jgi:hypothetical protein